MRTVTVTPSRDIRHLQPKRWYVTRFHPISHEFQVLDFTPGEDEEYNWVDYSESKFTYDMAKHLAYMYRGTVQV